MVKIKVENIVASTSLAEKLDLDMISQSLEETEYEPEQFPGLIYRLKNPKTTTVLFESGKANCTGAKNIEDVHKNVNIIAEKLRKLGVDVQDQEIAVQNIVAVINLERRLDLTETATGLGLENIEYEPEQFPGLVYRLEEPKVGLLIFSSGKIVCAGAKNVDDVSKAAEKIFEKLSSLGLLH